MVELKSENFIIKLDEPVMITGAGGFIGRKVVSNLLERGFSKVICFARRSSIASLPVEVVQGNLLSNEDCVRAVRGVKVIFHLAAGSGEKSYADAFLNSVITTRNLMEAAIQEGCLRRFVNISSFAVYSNCHKNSRVLDESGEILKCPLTRGDAYSYAKIKQDELVEEFSKKYNIPYVSLRPGAVYGPGKRAITGRVGIGTFGIFLHLGAFNKIPFSYVDNCADAIVLAGLKSGVDGQVFNIVDDDLPSSAQFLRSFKRNAVHFRSIYLPRPISYIFCYLWEWYSKYSRGQLPNTFNRARWHAEWKGSIYCNSKLKKDLGWTQKIPTAEGMRRYFEDCRKGGIHA